MKGDILHHFFSKSFVEYAVESAEEPDLRVDFEHLPKEAPEQAQVRWMSDGALVKEFMRWCDAAVDPKSFEYEDKELILKTLRTMFARAKGQKVEVG